MATETCPKLDTCQKVEMIFDKDLVGDRQYAEFINAVCAKCSYQQKDIIVIKEEKGIKKKKGVTATV